MDFQQPEIFVVVSKYNLAKYLELFVNIKCTVIAPHECVVSLDVVSIFIKIKLELARGTIIHLLDDFELGLPSTPTTKSLHHCLSKIFHFDNCLYYQIMGTPMGL